MTCDPRFYPGLGPIGGAAIPDVTVATFADLPTKRPDGFLVAVTAQSGLTEVIVRWNAGGSVWELLTVSCAWSVAEPLVFAFGAADWYNSGGTVVETANAALLTVTDKNRAYVFDASVAIDATAGGGTVGLWLTPLEYAGTPEVQMWGAGGESNATLATQGATITQGGTGAVSASGAFTQLSLTGATSVPFARVMMQTTLATAQPCTVRARVRGQITNPGTNGDQFGIYIGDNGTNVLILQRASGGFAMRDGFLEALPIRSADSLNASSSGTALPNTSTSPASIEAISPNRIDVSVLYRDGTLIHSVRRNADTTALGGSLVGFSAANIAGASATLTLQIQKFYVLTW